MAKFSSIFYAILLYFILSRLHDCVNFLDFPFEAFGSANLLALGFVCLLLYDRLNIREVNPSGSTCKLNVTEMVWCLITIEIFMNLFWRNLETIIVVLIVAPHEDEFNDLMERFFMAKFTMNVISSMLCLVTFVKTRIVNDLKIYFRNNWNEAMETNCNNLNIDNKNECAERCENKKTSENVSNCDAEQEPVHVITYKPRLPSHPFFS
ncbi:CLUMA_CG014844, isoform A [Clunio marinus]|uniref:CLUMA_CG014844, isoform A n=1 Tax=Clunio marinus TaxID=568069 RepID=A0A1J1IR76_9DIPT|nr:CLUMA_CG014844, isoform A [Clunio marinus]